MEKTIDLFLFSFQAKLISKISSSNKRFPSSKTYFMWLQIFISVNTILDLFFVEKQSAFEVIIFSLRKVFLQK